MFAVFAESYGNSQTSPDLTPVLVKLITAAAAADLSEPTTSSTTTSSSSSASTSNGHGEALATTTVFTFPASPCLPVSLSPSLPHLPVSLISLTFLFDPSSSTNLPLSLFQVTVTSNQVTPQQTAAKNAIETACAWSQFLSQMYASRTLASLPTGHPANPEGNHPLRLMLQHFRHFYESTML